MSDIKKIKTGQGTVEIGHWEKNKIRRDEQLIKGIEQNKKVIQPEEEKLNKREDNKNE